MTVRSGKDEAARFNKLLFERDGYPRGTVVLEMWPTFLNGNGSTHYTWYIGGNDTLKNSLSPSSTDFYLYLYYTFCRFCDVYCPTVFAFLCVCWGRSLTSWSCRCWLRDMGSNHRRKEKNKGFICILCCPFLVQWCHVVWKVAKTACKHTGCNINYVWKCNQREQLRLIERTASHMAQQYGVTLVHVSTAELQKSNSIFCCMVRVPFYRSCPYIFQCSSWYRPVSQKKITDICFGEH